MRRRSALTAACTVVVLVVGQLAASVHAARVRHVTCAAHGEEIEAPWAPGAPRSTQSQLLPGAPSAGGEHVECEIARVLHQSVDPLHHAPAIEASIVVASVVCVPPAAVAPSLDLVLLAPKTSPPA